MNEETWPVDYVQSLVIQDLYSNFQISSCFIIMCPLGCLDEHLKLGLIKNITNHDFLRDTPDA